MKYKHVFMFPKINLAKMHFMADTKWQPFLKTTFSIMFSCLKFVVLWFKFHWDLFPRVRLTHWGRDKIDAISQTTFLCAFSWMKMFEFRPKSHWSLFLRFQLKHSSTGLVNGLRCLGDKRLSEPMMVSLLTHICVTRPQWWLVSQHWFW